MINSGFMKPIMRVSGSLISEEMAVGSSKLTFTEILLSKIVTSVRLRMSRLTSGSRSESLILIEIKSLKEIA